MALGCTLVLTTLLVFAGPGGVQDDRQELASLLGGWQVEMAHEGGQPIPKERREQAKLTIDGSRFTLKDGKTTYSGELTLHFRDKPKAADLFVEVAGSQTVGVLGIYKLDKDTLTVCVTKAKQRPTEFKTVFGDTNAVLVFKRQAGEKAPH